MANWKAVDADDLDNKLAAIGNAIRGKTNKTNKILLQNMASEISGIRTTGGVLRVRVPAGTKCTISKGGVTRIATANSSGVATFSGLEEGIWAIRCENGEAAGNGQSNIKITYDVSVDLSGPVLYFNGDEFVSATGGWVGYTYNYRQTTVGTSTNNTVVKYDDNIMIWGAGAVGTNNRTDFRNFKKLYITYELTSYKEITGVRLPEVQIYDSKVVDTYRDNGLRKMSFNQTYGTPATVPLDINGISSGYIAFSGHTNDYNFYIEKVWLAI